MLLTKSLKSSLDLSNSNSDNLQSHSILNALIYSQQRHDEILNLERNIQSVHQLFEDMSVVVEDQSQIIDGITIHFDRVKENILLANEDLSIAKKHTRGCCAII